MNDTNERRYIKLNEKIYVAPLGVLYANNFKDYLVDNVIDADAMSTLELQQRFKIKDNLFGFLCNSITLFNDSDNVEYIEEIKEICKRIYSVDHMIKFFASQGKVKEALDKMDAFMIDILELSNRMFSKKKINHGKS